MKMLTCGSNVIVCAMLSLTAHIAKAQNTNGTYSQESQNEVDSSVTDTSHTIYGVLAAKADMTSKLVSANNLGVRYVRETQLLSKWNGTKNYSIDFWKIHKKKMVLNINNDSTPSPFPTNLAAYENKLRSFLNIYADDIELAVIENEELNWSSLQGNAYHLGSLQDYIRELSVAVNVCQEKGIPVTNGGLTNPIAASLKHYYQVNGLQDSLIWLMQNMNGISNDSTLWVRTDSLLAAYKFIPLSYVNLHWYEPVKDSTISNGALQVVCNYITQQTGKKVITNETGVKTTDSSFVGPLLAQWDSAGADYCVFYDGTGTFGAQLLTSSTGNLLLNGIAFRDHVAGKNSCVQSIAVTPGRSVITCSGTNVTLTASQGFSNYLWNTGDTSRIISVNATDNYSVTSSLENCTAFSNGVAVLVNSLPPKPVITTTPSPPTNICPSKTAKLTASSAMYYLWNTGGTTKAITVSKPGGYFVTVTDVNGCKNTSDSVTVTYKNCIAPTNLRVTDITSYRATLNWNTEACALGYQFQYCQKGTSTWTTGQVVQGSTSTRIIYNLLPSTTYQWRILTRCKITPDTLLSSYTPISEFTTLSKTLAAESSEAIANNVFDDKIFPVPAKNMATLTLSHISNDLQIELTDLNGKILWRSEKVTSKEISLPVSQLANGVYLVIVKDRDYNKVMKLVKE